MSSFYFTSNSVTLENSLQMRVVKFWENFHFREHDLLFFGILSAFMVKTIFLKLKNKILLFS